MAKKEFKGTKDKSLEKDKKTPSIFDVVEPTNTDIMIALKLIYSYLNR